MTATAASAVRARLERWQFWLVLGLVGVIAAVAVQLLDGHEAEPFGLTNTDLTGYAGLAAVLEEEGTEIHRTYSAQGARDLMEDHSGAPVVIMLRGFAPDEAFVTHLEQQARDGGEVIWLAEDAYLLADSLGGELQPGPDVPTGAAGTAQVLEAGDSCRTEAAAAAESIQAEGQSLLGRTGCFPVGSGGDTEGYVLTETSYGLAFTAPQAFTNQHITAQGNAALVLGLLGVSQDSAADSIIWYTPSGADSVGADEWESPLDYLPGWFWPLTAWLLICGVLATLVAGRRGGPVVTEPLPVTVPASESAHGRGRLYQQADAVGAAAQTLRSAHLLRLGRLLRLGPAAPTDAIASAATRESEWEEHQVSELLLTPGVHTHDQLTSYARSLARLENDVRDSTRMRRRPE